MTSTTSTDVRAASRAPAIAATPVKLADRRWAKAGILLAVFGLGIFQGYRWSEPEAQYSPVVYKGDSLVATGELEHALYDPVVGGANGATTVGPSFKGSLGERCRKFADGPIEGTACWHKGDWRVLEMRQD